MGRLLALALLFAACGSPAAPAPPASSAARAAPSSAPTATPTPTPTPRAKFPHGLYYVQPTTRHPGGTIAVLDSSAPLPVSVEFFGTGYDVSDDFVIGMTPQNDGFILYAADGSQRRLPVSGLFGIGRPSLSPDAKFVVVQATTIAPDASGMPKFLTDYVVDLSNGTYRRLVAPGTQEVAEGRELPRWFASGDRILYQTNDFPNGPGRPGCDIVRVLDAASGAVILTVNKDGPTGCFTPSPATGPRFHAEPSPDSSRILIPGQMQIFDAKTGALLADVRRQALDGIAAAGYRPDGRFPGQGNGGTYPLDGVLSADNKTITFDGAVEKDGTYGVVLCRINADGTGFTVLKPPVTVEPKFSNNHNYSQVLPRWH